MHQNTQTFSDITVIDTKNQLRIDLQLCRHGRTNDLVTINGQQITDITTTMFVDLLSPITLQIELLDFDEGHSGVEIQSFKINELEVLPKYQHLSSNGKCYIDTRDPWTFQIPKNFYMWYHDAVGQGWIA